MSQVKPERSYWRHGELSLFHRELGVGCPMTDIDFLAVESTGTRPAAIIEYKNEYSQPIDFESWQCQTLRNLCSVAQLPFYICRYSTDLTRFEIFPSNSAAFTDTAPALKQKGASYSNSFVLDRKRYVNFQYYIRGITKDKIPPEIISSVESYKVCTRQINYA